MDNIISFRSEMGHQFRNVVPSGESSSHLRQSRKQLKLSFGSRIRPGGSGSSLRSVWQCML